MRLARSTVHLIGLIAGIFALPLEAGAQPPRCVQHELQKFIASDAGADDRLGSSVSISGQRAVVGAWRADGGGGTTGAAYVFRRESDCVPSGPADDCWIEEDKLIPSDGSTGDLFGWSVAISGDYIVVGARFHFTGTRSGAAYVFRHDDNGTPADPSDDYWTEEDILVPADAATSDDVGSSVAIDGDRIVVGAPKNDDACPEDTSCNSGSAYVFRHDDNGTPEDLGDDFWFEEAKLTASDAELGDNFAFSVSISGERLMAGAWHNDDDGTDSGSAYVFRYDDNATPSDPSDDNWTEEDKLVASDSGYFDNFGVDVAISGNRGVVGAWLNDGEGQEAGAAYVFRHDDNGTPLDPNDDFWVEEAKLTAADATSGDEFGKSVSMDGDWIAVGAYEDDDACANDVQPDPDCDSGSAYVFRRVDGASPSDPGDHAWMQTGKLLASDTTADEFFGRVAISDGRVITGSLNGEAGPLAGAAYIYSANRACASLVDAGRFQTCRRFSGPGESTFSDIEAGLLGVFLSSVSWGDFDDDDDLDLALAGNAGLDYVSRIYRNDGGDTFTDINAGLTGVAGGSLAWGDYDGDGDLDLVIAGDTGAGFVSLIYRNDDGVFTDITAGLVGVAYASLDWGDYDNDGDLDLALAGDAGSEYVTRIYRNDGNGAFTAIGAGLVGVAYAALEWGDFDLDDNLDLALAGDTVSGPVARIYRNEGAGVFGDIEAGLTGVLVCDLSWGDYDSDGDIDLVLAGNTGSESVAQIYRNNHGSSFTDLGAELVAVGSPALSWGDFDYDGDLDLVLAGNTGSGPETRIYSNTLGDFAAIDAGLVGVFLASASWGDYDGDLDLDLVLAGQTNLGPVTRIYRRDGEDGLTGCHVFDLDGDGDVDLGDYGRLLLTFTGP